MEVVADIGNYVSVFRILSPGTRIGRVIGPRGSTIRNLRDETPSRVYITDRHLVKTVIIIYAKDTSGNQNPPAVHTLLRIHDIINPREGDGSNIILTRFLARRDNVKCILDNHGGTLVQLQQRTGITIKIEDDQRPLSLPDDAIISISGPYSGVHEAVSAFANIFRSFLVEESMVSLFFVAPYVSFNGGWRKASHRRSTKPTEIYKVKVAVRRLKDLLNAAWMTVSATREDFPEVTFNMVDENLISSLEISRPMHQVVVAKQSIEDIVDFEGHPHDAAT